ncbi:E3 ubiquitin-protein ligase ZFP91 isoform X2 [Bombina bombina]|uniref:E3 ubiquitin-protein ligase ZFP91 isoform X2 n=1 Tax=Bombina bombina TaxID=8345 RepID=UPI00235B2B95|nr:E3 ubiquitin-protein ligase ZFP91 isoform X2 [Bombina bombina]
MPGGPEPQGGPKRVTGDEGAAMEEEVVVGGSSRRRKAECPRRRRSRRELPEEEESLHVGGDGYMDEEIVIDKEPKCEVEDEELVVQDMEPTILIQDPHLDDEEGCHIVRGGVLRSSRMRHPPALQLICKTEPEQDQLVYEISEEPATFVPAISEEEDVMISEEEVPFKDDPRDETYRPQIDSEDEEEELSDDEAAYKDDPKDKTYRPQVNREPSRPRRRTPRVKEEVTPVEVKLEVKEEGQVQEEETPRKRGRRRKDDKSPRPPKRRYSNDSKRKKPPIQYVRCEMEGCGTVLAHPRYLQHHIKYQHLLKKKYVCPHPSCGRLFRLQKQLLRHAKHHTDQRDYICEYCARAFKSSHNLAVHRMIHTGEKPLQCEFCGFTCRQKASLNWHMKKHDADSFYQFSCGICGKKFEKKDSVVAHKAKSHPEVLIAEALAANAGALITSPELLVPETPVAPEEPASPQDFYSNAGSQILVECPVQSAEGLVATTEVLIEDSDSAGP